MGIRRSFRPSNLVINGDFAQGTSGWNQINAATIAIDSDGDGDNKALKVTGTGPYAYIGNDPAISVVNGNKYYVRARVKKNNSTQVTLGFYRTRLGNPHAANIIYTFLGETYEKVSTIFTANATDLLIVFYPDTVANTNGKIALLDKVLLINLTTLFGAGLEPNTAWCDNNIPIWFDGTLSGGRIGGIGGLH